MNIYLPENSQFNLDAQAGSGQIVTEFPVSITFQGKLEKSTLKGRVNGGGSALPRRVPRRPRPGAHLPHFRVEHQSQEDPGDSQSVYSRSGKNCLRELTLIPPKAGLEAGTARL